MATPLLVLIILAIVIIASIITSVVTYVILSGRNKRIRLAVDSPRPRHRADPAQSSAIFHAPKVHIPPSAESADTRYGRSVCLLPAP